MQRSACTSGESHSVSRSRVRAGTPRSLSTSVPPPHQGLLETAGRSLCISTEDLALCLLHFAIPEGSKSHHHHHHLYHHGNLRVYHSLPDERTHCQRRTHKRLCIPLLFLESIEEHQHGGSENEYDVTASIPTSIIMIDQRARYSSYYTGWH